MKLKFFAIGLIVSFLLAASPFLFFYFQKNLSKTNSLPKKEARRELPIAADIFLATGEMPIKPARNWDIADIVIPAKIALIYETSQNNILFKKNGINEPRPIASLTKMMTALVVLENSKLTDIFKISENAVKATGEMGGLKIGEELNVEALLKIMLIESSNDAAVALAKGVENLLSQNQTGSEKINFIDLMNKKARMLGLLNTVFTDSSGLSSDNKSTAWDLVLTMKEVLKSQMLKEIMQTSVADVPAQDGAKHHLISTNKLLGRIADIIAGKTGYTQEAGNCMILATKSPYYDNDAIITVVMDAQDRITETEQLIKWTKQAFLW